MRTCVRFTLERPPYAGQTFIAVLWICPNPCCPCGVVAVICRPELPVEPAAPSVPAPETLRFELDVIRRVLDANADSTPESAALGRAFVAEADAEEWKWLSDLFRSTKKTQMENVDLETLKVDLPARVKAAGAQLLPYSAIFPWTDSFRFAYAGAEWFADDQYCVRPGCECTEAGLAFYCATAEGVEPREPLRCAVFLHLDYVTGEIGLVETPGRAPALDALVQALRLANPAMPDTLRGHHSQLRRLCRRLMPKSARASATSLPPPVWQDLDAATEEWLLQPPDPRILRAMARPGRNDPCPCGSGRKFKKCCGAVGRDTARGS